MIGIYGFMAFLAIVFLSILVFGVVIFFISRNVGKRIGAKYSEARAAAEHEDQPYVVIDAD